MEYKDRLKAARKHASLTQGQLAEAIGITQTSISDLERGKSKGTTFNARIAKVCGVSALWLEDGIGEMLPKDGHNNVAPAIQPHRPQRKYPVLSEVPAGHPRESVAYLPQHAEEHYPSTENAGPNGYWLKVEGPSMTSTSHPSFPEGTLILVQPEGFDLISGKYYIAQHRATDGTIKATFKKYINDCGREYLAPLNPEFDTIRMGHDWDIIGRVIDIRIKDL